MKKALNIFLSALVVLIVCFIAFKTIYFRGTEEKDRINSWLTSDEHGIAFQQFSDSLYKNYYSGNDYTVAMDISYNNSDTYLIKQGNDENSEIEEIDGFDINSMFYQLERCLSTRRFHNIIIKKDEVVFYDDYTGNQLIYSLTGKEPEGNLFISKKLRFTKYNDNWYSYFEPFKDQSEWRKTVLFVLADIFFLIIISLLVFLTGHAIKKNKKEKSFNPLLLSIITLTILFLIAMSYAISHSTYYKYNDFKIYGRNIEEIEAKYGNCSFIHIRSDKSGSAGYSMNIIGEMYLMYFNEKGTVYKIDTGVGPGG